MISLSFIVAGVMLIVSLFHFYWAFGGSYALKSAGPSLESEEDFIPSRLLIFIVAIFLFGLAILANQLVHPLKSIEVCIPYIGYFVSVIFIVRAIGDFKYVGFSKKVYNSNFAKLDTKFFSPVILFLGIGYGVLAMYGT